ncbi:hypothetical protein SLE2022_259020 [Rubroshorea leprosula]
MPPKVSTFCTISVISLLLLLFFGLTSASRSEPLYSGVTSPVITQHEEVQAEESGCDDGVGEEECLIRRTLTAHIDYVYTQKINNP